MRETNEGEARRGGMRSRQRHRERHSTKRPRETMVKREREAREESFRVVCLHQDLHLSGVSFHPLEQPSQQMHQSGANLW